MPGWSWIATLSLAGQPAGAPAPEGPPEGVEPAPAPVAASAEEPEPAAESEAPPEPDEGNELRAVLLQVVGSDDAALLEALQLRLPGVAFYGYGADDFRPPTDGIYVYLHVNVTAHERHEVLAIVSDGRSYAREVVAEPAAAGRSVAGFAAVLLRGIAEGTEPPDRSDVSILHPDPPQPPAPPPPPERAPDRREIGIRLTPGGAFGVAPTQDIGASGIGFGALGLQLKFASGGLLAAALRMGGQRADGVGLLRIRAGLGGGYVFRTRTFELPITALLTVEPWVLIADDTDLVRDGDTPGRTAPLLGGAVRIAPGARFKSRSSHVGWRLGVAAELSGSGAFDGGFGVPRVMRDENALFRLGGLELAFGVELGIWFELGTKRGSG